MIVVLKRSVNIMLKLMDMNHYENSQWSPGGARDAAQLPVIGQQPPLDARHAVRTDTSAYASCNSAAVLCARGARVAWQFVQVLKRLFRHFERHRVAPEEGSQSLAKRMIMERHLPSLVVLYGMPVRPAKTV